MEVKDAIADQIDMGAPPAPGTQRGFQEAVLAVATRAKAALPDATDRLDTAAALVLAGEVPLSVSVGRRITPPTADSDRSVPVSVHSAPQYPDACHADLAGDSPRAPAFSHHGSVHGALADLQSANHDGSH